MANMLPLSTTSSTLSTPQPCQETKCSGDLDVYSKSDMARHLKNFHLKDPKLSDTAASSGGTTPNQQLATSLDLDLDKVLKELLAKDHSLSSEPTIAECLDEPIIFDLNAQEVVNSLPPSGPFQPPVESFAKPPDTEILTEMIAPNYFVEQPKSSIDDAWRQDVYEQDPRSPGINAVDMSEILLQPKEISCSFEAEEIPKLVASNQMLFRNTSPDLQKVFHVRSGRSGRFSLNMEYTNVPPFNTVESSLQLKIELKRIHQEYKHIPVNKVCEKHQEEGDKNHPILPALMEPEDKYKHSIDGSHLWYSCGFPNDGLLKEQISLSFPCNDSCETSNSQMVRKEAARDVLLSCSLFLLGNDGSEKCLHTERIHVWPKATITKRDLDKLERHLPKGSIAQQAAMKRRLDAANATLEKKIKMEDPTNDDDIFLKEYRSMKAAGKIDESAKAKLIHFLSKICH